MTDWVFFYYCNRETYELELNKVNLHVHFSDWFSVSQGALQPQNYQSSCLPLTLDRRQTLADLRFAVMEVITGGCVLPQVGELCGVDTCNE